MLRRHSLVEQLLNILGVLREGYPLKDLRIFQRIGLFCPNSPSMCRPIRVEFSTRSQRDEVLGNKHKLGRNGFPRVGICEDRPLPLSALRPIVPATRLALKLPLVDEPSLLHHSTTPIASVHMEPSPLVTRIHCQLDPSCPGTLNPSVLTPSPVAISGPLPSTTLPRLPARALDFPPAKRQCAAPSKNALRPRRVVVPLSPPVRPCPSKSRSRMPPASVIKSRNSGISQQQHPFLMSLRSQKRGLMPVS